MELPELTGYIIERELGKGSMAIVYLATQTKFERKVALKVLSPNLVPNPVFGDQFQSEAMLVARLNHQHIVPIYDLGQQGDYHYQAMEYLPRGDLRQKLQSGMSLSESIYIVKCIAQALDYASGKHCVHRDVKPENILFRDDGSPVLSDFGIALSDDTETPFHQAGKGVMFGTPTYMSPEQSLGTAVDGRSDLYSLGVIFFMMVSGRAPYHGDSANSLARQHASSKVPLLPPSTAQFQGFVDIALAKEPDDRFQTGRELIEALVQIEQQHSTETGSTAFARVTQCQLSSAADLTEKTVVSSTGYPQQSAPDSPLPSPTRAGFMRPSNERSHRKRRYLAAAVVACLIAIGTALTLWQSFPRQLNVATKEPVISRIKAEQEHITPANEDRAREPARHDTVRRLMMQAEEYKLAGERRSAIRNLRGVLDLEPENEAAQAALDGELSALYSITRQQIKDGKFNAAEATLGELNRIGADQEQVTVLRSALYAAHQEQEKRRVADATAAASATAADLEPENEAAQAALDGELSALYSITRQQIKDGKFNAAEATLGELNRIGADQEQVTVLRSALYAAHQEQEKRRVADATAAAASAAAASAKAASATAAPATAAPATAASATAASATAASATAASATAASATAAPATAASATAASAKAAPAKAASATAALATAASATAASATAAPATAASATAAPAKAASATANGGAASEVATVEPTAHIGDVTAASNNVEESRLLQSANKLTDQQRTISVNEELRHVYQQILAINPDNTVAIQGLDSTSDFESSRVRRAIEQRNFDSASHNIALIANTTPNYSGLVALNVQLEEAEAAHARASEELVRAEAQIVVPYKYYRSRSRNTASRQRLLEAQAHIEKARQLDAGHPDLPPAMARMEQEYAYIISLLLAKNKLNLAEDFLSDSLGKSWAGQLIAETQARYEDQKAAEGGDVSSFGNIGF